MSLPVPSIPESSAVQHSSSETNKKPIFPTYSQNYLYNKRLWKKINGRIRHLIEKLDVEEQLEYKRNTHELLPWLLDFKSVMDLCQQILDCLKDFRLSGVNDDVGIYLDQMKFTTDLRDPVKKILSKMKIFAIQLDGNSILSPEVEECFVKLLANNAAMIRALPAPVFETIDGKFQNSFGKLTLVRRNIQSAISDLSKGLQTFSNNCQESFKFLKKFCTINELRVDSSLKKEIIDLFQKLSKDLDKLKIISIDVHIMKINNEIMQATTIIKSTCDDMMNEIPYSNVSNKDNVSSKDYLNNKNKTNTFSSKVKGFAVSLLCSN